MSFNDFIKSINNETCTDENGYPYYQTYQLKEAYEAAAVECWEIAKQAADEQSVKTDYGTGKYHAFDQIQSAIKEKFELEI